MRRTIAFLAIVLMSVAANAQTPRKNVLFIAIDDMNCRLGCFGDPIAKTPNIDALAKRGVLFKRAYCQYPLCNPSRVSLMTGLRPDTTKIYDLKTNFRSTVPDAVTLPQLFKQNGYFVARVGKLFHYGVPREIGTNGFDDPASWEYVFNPIGIDKAREKDIHLLTLGTGKGTIGFSMSWLDIDGPDEDHTDAKGVTETIRLLEANKDKPFFIANGFFRPHTPFIAPKKYFDLYPIESIKLPKRDKKSDQAVLDVSKTIRPDDYGLSEKDLKDCVRAYYASMSFVDAQIGRLIETLDRLKLSDNTLIVFWSDHGFLLGEHGQWQKQLLFDPSPRMPMIVADPAAKGNGTACEKPVELLDLYPTVADWASLKKPENLEGFSLRPLLDDPADAKWDHAAYSQVTRMVAKKELMGRSVFTEQFHYTEWDDGKAGAELYDLKSDPDELHNLAKEDSQATTISQMKDLLAKIRK